MSLKSSRQSERDDAFASSGRTTGSRRTMPRRVAPSSRSFTTAFASARRPFRWLLTLLLLLLTFLPLLLLLRASLLLLLALLLLHLLLTLLLLLLLLHLLLTLLLLL